MSKLRTVRSNTVADMWRFGWVTLSYDMWSDRWMGRDETGNKYSITNQAFYDRSIDWLDFACDGVTYRCCKPQALKDAGAEKIPLRNASNNR